MRPEARVWRRTQRQAQEPVRGSSRPRRHLTHDAPRHAGRGAATPNGEGNVNTDLIDANAAPLTQAGQDYLIKQLDAAWQERQKLSGKRDGMLRELGSIERVIRVADQSIELLQAELGYAVSLLPPDFDPVDLADEPEDELPLEAEAHQAALAAQARGRDPYSHVVTGLLPQAPGHVHAPGSFDASTWPRQEAER